jgi:hypothetical protein
MYTEYRMQYGDGVIIYIKHVFYSGTENIFIAIPFQTHFVSAEREE